ncbi:hypothetical protein NIES267_73760 (plasmid) [Calothrix parasitica NIES-267]|uniref:Uncharacterized protein n=1 Tax=Calothrix parasitica NIES-267 TaxID=1973488 RepID=A0A1Z4M301_9CYAN|nr:hypothetical protein NIES267_73760 [Calothrix parasitica NIES-267]
MRTSYAAAFFTGAPVILASCTAYLINQLPPTPQFPYRDHVMIGGVIITVLLHIIVGMWLLKKEAQKSSGAGQPVSSSTPTPTYLGASGQSYQKQYVPQRSGRDVSWATLFVVSFFHFSHFFPALIVGYFFQSYRGINLTTALAGALVVAWVWTGILTWGWSQFGGWVVGIVIVLLANAGWWALCFGVGLLVVSILRSVLSVFNSGYKSWSLTGILVCSTMAALFFAKAWGWILGVITAWILVSCASASKMALDHSFDEYLSVLILILDAIIGTATGGWVGWTIRLMN